MILNYLIKTRGLNNLITNRNNFSLNCSLLDSFGSSKKTQIAKDRLYVWGYAGTGALGNIKKFQKP